MDSQRVRNMILFGVIVGIILFGFWHAETYITGAFLKYRSSGVLYSTGDKYAMCRNERIEMSKKMTKIVQNFHMLQCEVQNTASETGGWCNKAVEEGHMTDHKFATALAEMLAMKSIGSFGDGRGDYRTFILNTGRITHYDSFDGAPNIENITEDRVRFMDLTIKNYGVPIYDWIVSTEVAEHIPEQYESTYLNNIFRHAREGIVLSWAVPGQGGYKHVNLRTKAYVVAKMHENCFDINTEKSDLLRNSSGLGWLRNNLMVFYRRPNCPIDEDEA